MILCPGKHILHSKVLILPEILHCILVMLHNYKSNIDGKLFNPFMMIDSLDVRPRFQDSLYTQPEFKTHSIQVQGESIHSLPFQNLYTHKSRIYPRFLNLLYTRPGLVYSLYTRIIIPAKHNIYDTLTSYLVL